MIHQTKVQRCDDTAPHDPHLWRPDMHQDVSCPGRTATAEDGHDWYYYCPVTVQKAGEDPQPCGLEHACPKHQPEPELFATVRVGANAFVRDDGNHHLPWSGWLEGHGQRHTWSHIVGYSYVMTGYPPVLLTPVQPSAILADDDDRAGRVDLAQVKARYMMARLAGTSATDGGDGWTADRIDALARSWQDVATMHDELLHLRREQRGNIGDVAKAVSEITALISPAEERAIMLTAQLADALGTVVDYGRTRQADLGELVAHVHAIQHALMSQVAARIWPDRYRLLGGQLPTRARPIRDNPQA